MKRFVLCMTFAQAAFISSARAQSVGTETSTAAKVQPILEEKREKPDLDGRGDPPADAGDVLIWIPRVIFAPVHLVTEWVIRKPLGAFLTAAEQGRWADLFVDFFTFEERRIGIFPTFFLDFNFRPSVGFYFFWNELFVEQHSIRLIGGYGGSDWYRLSFVDQWSFNEDGSRRLEFQVGYLGRPDYIFGGSGLDANPDLFGRYFEETIDGQARLLWRSWRASEFRLEAGVAKHSFGSGASDGDNEFDLATLDERPFAFDEGYTAAFQRALLTLDSRRPRPNPTTGARASLKVENGWDIDRPERAWVRVGGELGGYIDVSHYRTLGLSVLAEAVNPTGSEDDVPFTELVILGRRPNDLGGFLPGVLSGRSATVVTLEYNYPIWVFLDGSIRYSVGNVFGPNLDDFSLGALRSSIGIGFQSSRMEDNGLVFQFALGTSRFDDAFEIDSARLVFGTQAGF